MLGKNVYWKEIIFYRGSDSAVNFIYYFNVKPDTRSCTSGLLLYLRDPSTAFQSSQKHLHQNEELSHLGFRIT